MKKRSLSIFVVVSLLMISFGFRLTERYPSVAQRITIQIDGDSGFILKKECIDVLKQLSMTDDTSPGTWSIFEDSDTLGRYFYSPENDHYLVCLHDSGSEGFETHVLVELAQTDDGKFEVLAKERYSHGNYPCSWNGRYWIGFQRDGYYFRFEYSGTGSDFCGAHYYYFKNVVSQESLKPISAFYSAIWDGGPEAITLDNTHSWKGDTLIYHYVLQPYNVTYNEQTDEVKWNISGPEDTSTVRYFFKANSWWTPDSAKIVEY